VLSWLCGLSFFWRSRASEEINGGRENSSRFLHVSSRVDIRTHFTATLREIVPSRERAVFRPGNVSYPNE
jgi:hypothetical protein